MARSDSNSAAAGCLGVGLVIALVWAVVSFIVSAVVAFFQTPIPYVALVAAGIYYFARRIHSERVSKVHWDVVAGMAGLAPWPADVDRRLWQRGRNEPDVLLLQGASLANAGNITAAYECFEKASRFPSRIGRISGGIAFWLPAQVEPIAFGSGNSGPNLALARGHLALLAGDAIAALQWLQPRLHEPHFAAALASLADAHRSAGSPARAVAMLRMELFRVGNPEAQHQLRYRLADLLESLGAPSEAAAEFRILAHQSPTSDAPRRLATLEAKLREQHARHIAENDAAAYRAALVDFHAARGPKSRDDALARALATIVQPHLREQFLLEASRVEVQAVLDKVSTLKTKNAKLRNLHEALARIRTDPIPDHLQAAELAELERAVAAVEAS